MLWTILNDPMDSSCAHWHWNYALIDFCHFTESTLIITPSPQIKTLYMKVLFFYHTHRIPVCYNYFGYFRVYEQNLNTKLFIRMKNETLKKYENGVCIDAMCTAYFRNVIWAGKFLRLESHMTCTSGVQTLNASCLCIGFGFRVISYYC